MTNKSMVGVPRELLERWAERFSKAQIFKESSEVRAILTAPAEDVRAVVDEPVAYQVTDENGVIGNYYPFPHWAAGYNVHPLYRHPRRPMVLPERIEPTQDEPYMTEASHGWNACLDEISRQNK